MHSGGSLKVRRYQLRDSVVMPPKEVFVIEFLLKPGLMTGTLVSGGRLDSDTTSMAAFTAFRVCMTRRDLTLCKTSMAMQS